MVYGILYYEEVNTLFSVILFLFAQNDARCKLYR